MHGLDDVLSDAVVANGSAYLLDASRQVRLRHEPMPPHPVKKVVLGDDTIAVLDQVHEEIERLRLQVDQRASATQLAAGHVDLALCKPVHHIILTAQGDSIGGGLFGSTMAAFCHSFGGRAESGGGGRHNKRSGRRRRHGL